MTIGYVMRRLAVFLIVVWLAASFNFLLPRLGTVNPVRQKLTRTAAFGVNHFSRPADADEYPKLVQVINTWEAKFGLDQPLWKQYLRYLGDTARLDLGRSINNFPARVIDIILRGIPWSLLLIGMSTLIAFVIGTVFGAVMVWRRSSLILSVLGPLVMALAAIPYYLLALGLIFIVAFTWGLLPISGGYDIGTIPDVSVGFYAEAARHAVLPALSIILAQMGFWAIHMRGMMVTVLEEDYMILGEAKGLKGHRLFLRYAMRSAILPQATNLALTLGLILTQSVLVEVVFSYPGIGNVLFTAIRNLDYFLIYGIVFTMIVSVSLATLVIDLVYPLLDPRIRYAPS